MLKDLLCHSASVEVRDLSPTQKIIRELDFIGTSTASEDGSNVLIFTDGGSLFVPEWGEYAAVCHGYLTAQAKMMRPKHGKIANNGVFIFDDWMFGKKLHGAFCAFHPNGSAIIRHYVRAIPFNNGLSSNGRYAVMQCNVNLKSKDNLMLFFYDLEQGALIWRSQPISGRATAYYFNLERKLLVLKYNHQPSEQYSFSGDYLGVGGD